MTDAEPSTDEPTAARQPTPEQYAERARRADKATRGALAGILGLEAVVVLLIPRAIAFTTGLGAVRTGICIGLAVVLVAAAGLLRRPWGIGVGSVLQLVFIATGVMIATMFLVGALFLAIWLRLLMLRHEVVGTPAACACSPAERCALLRSLDLGRLRQRAAGLGRLGLLRLLRFADSLPCSCRPSSYSRVRGIAVPWCSRPRSRGAQSVRPPGGQS